MIPYKKLLECITLITILATVSLFYFDDLMYLLMPNKLSAGHNIMSDQCEQCHFPFANEFDTCLKCHKEVAQISLHAKDKKAVPCSFCHNSHGETIRNITPESCLASDCHKPILQIQDHSGNTELCFQCHPEHQFERKGEKIKKTNLIFSHKIHSDESKTKAFSPCIYCHILSPNEIDMGLPEALRQCKRCHKKETGKHDTTRKIKEKECSWCHYPETKIIAGLNKPFRLELARMNHQNHSGFNCNTCHYQIENIDELEDVRLLAKDKKAAFCAQCHENKQKIEDRKIFFTNPTDTRF